MPGDTRNKRTPLERKRDRLKIAEMYIQGKYQSEIAHELGLCQQQISFDLKAIQKEWQKITTLSLDEFKNKELAKIDNLERTYWQAWDRSLEEFKSNTIKAKNAENAEKISKTEERNGDPRYLLGIQWCIEQRCKILGIYQQTEISGIVINLISSREVNLENC